jgi:uncharacterized RDD family membrane protein YckC
MNIEPSTEPRNTALRRSYAEKRAADLAVSTRGVFGPRIVSYVIDLMLVGLLALILWMAVGMLGVLTFGWGWYLLPAVGICAAMGYAAVMIGGRGQATLGMRVSGLKVERAMGGAPDGVSAAAHALLFYVATGTGVLLAATLLCGLVRPDRRLGHDLLTGLVLVKA